MYGGGERGVEGVQDVLVALAGLGVADGDVAALDGHGDVDGVGLVRQCHQWFAINIPCADKP